MLMRVYAFPFKMICGGCAHCLELGIFPHLVAEESWTLPLNCSLGNSFEQLDQLARVCINKLGYGTLDKPHNFFEDA